MRSRPPESPVGRCNRLRAISLVAEVAPSLRQDSQGSQATPPKQLCYSAASPALTRAGQARRR
eukprot:3423066-Alexandrium_andersonii.AAC.1